MLTVYREQGGAAQEHTRPVLAQLAAQPLTGTSCIQRQGGAAQEHTRPVLAQLAAQPLTGTASNYASQVE